MATASDISRICKDKITFYEGITDFTAITNDDVLVDFVPSWNTVNSVADTPIVTFTTPNTGAATTDVVLRGVHAPEFGTDAANKAYVDGLTITGVSWKNTVHATIIGNIALPITDGVTTANTQSDGVTLALGDRVLLLNQTNASQNGIYDVKSPEWERSADVDDGANASGFAVWVDSGALNGDKGFVVTTDSGIDIVGTHDITWANFSSAQGVAGNDGDLQINLNDGHDAVTNGTLNWNTTTDSLTIVGGSGSGEALDVSGGYASFHNGIEVLGSGSLHLASDLYANFGTSGELKLRYNSSANVSEISTATGGDIKFSNNHATEGDLVISNANAADGRTIIRLGDAAGLTEFIIQDSAETEAWKMNSDGAVTHTLGSYTLLDSIPLNVGTDSDLVISHDGAEASIVNSTGILNIQQTASGSDLNIENTSATAGDGIEFKLAASTVGTSFSFIGDSAGAPVTLMEIVAASQDSTSFTTGTVRITGGLAVTQDVTAVCVNMLSDATTKTNIEPLSNPLSKIKQIEGFNYNFLPGYGSNDRMNTGVLAQQIETIQGLEHCVTTDKESGYKSVNYTFLIPMMIEGMKELSEKVEKMAAKIEELER